MSGVWHIPALAGTEREYLLWVDVTRWPGLQLMSAICAQATAGVDVKPTLQIVLRMSQKAGNGHLRRLHAERPHSTCMYAI